jgi:hypothetical protein
VEDLVAEHIFFRLCLPQDWIGHGRIITKRRCPSTDPTAHSYLGDRSAQNNVVVSGHINNAGGKCRRGSSGTMVLVPLFSPKALLALELVTGMEPLCLWTRM